MFCPDYIQDDDFDNDRVDEWEEAMSNCGLFRDGDTWACMSIGTEYCDWDCRFSNEIGDPVEDDSEDD